jgi:hypothetical protein
MVARPQSAADMAAARSLAGVVALFEAVVAHGDPRRTTERTSAGEATPVGSTTMALRLVRLAGRPVMVAVV